MNLQFRMKLVQDTHIPLSIRKKRNYFLANPIYSTLRIIYAFISRNLHRKYRTLFVIHIYCTIFVTRI